MGRRIFIMLVLALTAVSCKPASEQLVIRDWRTGHLESLGLGAAGATAELTVELDVENTTRSTFAIESLVATVYKRSDGGRFADIVLHEAVSLGAKTCATVQVPLEVTLANPLALLMGGLDNDLSKYTADVDIKVRKGAFTKNIHEERVPLDELLDGFKDKNIITDK